MAPPFEFKFKITLKLIIVNVRVKSKENNSLFRLDIHLIIEKLQRFAETQYGCEEILKLKPSDSEDEAKKFLSETNEFVELLKNHRSPILRGTPYIIPHLLKSSKGAVLESGELHEILLFLEKVISLKRFFEKEKDLPIIWSKAVELNPPEALLESLKRVITEEGKIRENATEHLKYLILKKLNLRQRIVGKMEDLLEIYASKLQDRFWTIRNGRAVLPVKIEESSHIKGIIQGTSQTEKTCFIEPEEVVELNNEYAMLSAEIEEEILRILRKLTDEVSLSGENLRRCAEFISCIDLNLARAKFSLYIKGNPVEFSKEIYIKDMKPVQLLMLKEKEDDFKEVVPSTLFMHSSHKGLLIMGPNAGGKTVFLKAIGGAVFLSKMGIFIPSADRARVRFYRKIFTLVGEYQDIEMGYSSFSGRMLCLSEILKEARPGDLILLDEPFAGTSLREAVALERAMVEYLIKRGIDFIITSNQIESFDIAKNSEKILWGSMGFDPHKNIPTFEFKSHFVEITHAFDVVKKAGIPDEITQRAEKYLGEEFLSLKELLEKINLDYQKLRIMEEELKARLERVKEEEDKLAREKKRVRLSLKKKLEEELKRVKEKLNEEIERVRLKNEFEGLKRLKEEIIEMEREWRSEESSFTPQEGSIVKIKSTGARGKVIKIEGKYAVVEIRGVRWTLPFIELEPG